MRLLVISHTVHHRNGDRLVGWGPTVREIDHLAGIFEQIACRSARAAGERIAVSSRQRSLVAVPPAGGPSL
jgi:hypothetical protein